MARTVLCIWAAIVAGFGLAVVLALGTASFSAAAYKAEQPINQPIYTRVQALAPAIKVAAGIGFVVGAGIVAAMAYASRPSKGGPVETVQNDRSEV